MKVLIVEDEMLVACHLESMIEDLGFEATGIAADAAEAKALAVAEPDIALVDLNLRDGLSGPEIGAYLGSHGVSVIFVTANPNLVQPPVPGAIGVVAKPCDDRCIEEALRYASLNRVGQKAAPPSSMRLL